MTRHEDFEMSQESYQLLQLSIEHWHNLDKIIVPGDDAFKEDFVISASS